MTGFGLQRRSAWRTGPPKWAYSGWAIALASAHLALAGFDVGRFFDLFEVAWPFYSTLIGITSATAATLHVTGRRPPGAAPDPEIPGIPRG
jgi:hypothetical protein